ncbi:uncharacterized protein LOC134723095 [Mytilus trossulus]|uniref:uncharacterized protein LOC134723095 n=1 Tax=Mytilus trossulus TaxID=6551 RepID=UPI003004B19B
MHNFHFDIYISDANVPVSDSNLSAADNPLTSQNVQNTIGSTDLEMEQHNNGIIHSAVQGQTFPNQNLSVDSIKNSDVANGNSMEIISSTDSTPSDSEAAVNLAIGQKTPESNAEGQKENLDSTPESHELIFESNSASKDQTRETPTSQEQIPDSDPKPFSHEQTRSKRDEDKMEVSSSQIPGSKNKTSHTQNTNDEPETPLKKLKLTNESDSPRFQESSSNNRTVPIQPHSVFGPDKNQDKTIDFETTTDSQVGPDRNQDKTTDSETTTDSQVGPDRNQDKTTDSETTTDSQAGPDRNQDKTTDSETTTNSQAGPDRNQDKTTDSETTTDYQAGPDKNQDKTSTSETTTDSQTGPGSERFKDSFIFGALSNPTNPSYFKGESSSQKDDTEVSQEREGGHKDKDKTDKEISAKSEKEGKQDEESSEDDSSESKDSDSEKSDGDGKNLPASKKKNKDRKSNKKKKEEKKKERKKRKENKDGNSNTNSSSTKDTRSSTGSNSADTKSYGTKEKASVAETASSSSKKPEGKKQSTGSFVDVCFHAVISPTILINPDKDFVVIAFEKYGGGWESKQHKLKLERELGSMYV